MMLRLSMYVCFLQIKTEKKKPQNTKTKQKKKQLESFLIDTHNSLVENPPKETNLHHHIINNKRKTTTTPTTPLVTFTPQTLWQFSNVAENSLKELRSCDSFRKLPVRGNAIMETSVTMITITDDIPAAVIRLILECIASRSKVIFYK